MSKELTILEILWDAHPRELYGLEIVKRSKGRLGRGTVYVRLSRMEKRGEVSSRLEDESETEYGIRRSLYRITDAGRRVRDQKKADNRGLSFLKTVLGS